MKKLRGVEEESLAVVSKRMRHYCSVKGRHDEEAGQVYEVVEPGDIVQYTHQSQVPSEMNLFVGVSGFPLFFYHL